MRHFLISKSEHSHPGASPASPLKLQMTEILDCSTTSAKCLPQKGEQQLLALGWPSKVSEASSQPGVSSLRGTRGRQAECSSCITASVQIMASRAQALSWQPIVLGPWRWGCNAPDTPSG